jgi:hypothetical protein
MRPFVSLCILLRIEDHLRDALPVAKVYEDEPSMVPAALHPAHENNHFTNVLPVQAVAVVRLYPITQGIQACLLKVHLLRELIHYTILPFKELVACFQG